MLRVEVSRDILYPTLYFQTLDAWQQRVSDWMLTIGPGFPVLFPPVVTRLENAVVYMQPVTDPPASTYPVLIREWSQHGHGVTVERITQVDVKADPASDASALDATASSDNPLSGFVGKVETALGVGVTVLVVGAVVVGLVWYSSFLPRRK